MVVLSGFQRYFCMQYTTSILVLINSNLLFYQDFKDTFVCNTQLLPYAKINADGCFIRISKILLYAIHNTISVTISATLVVLSGFQRYFCMQYTTELREGDLTKCCFIRISKILLYAIHNRHHEEH